MKSIKQIMKKSSKVFIKVFGLTSLVSTLASCIVFVPCAYGPAPTEQEDEQVIENPSEDIKGPESDFEIR